MFAMIPGKLKAVANYCHYDLNPGSGGTGRAC